MAGTPASCSARTLPAATGFTASRWDGLGSRVARSFLPPYVRSVLAARWEETSSKPGSAAGKSSRPVTLRSSLRGGKPSRVHSSARRPRCAMPITTSDTPAAAAPEKMASSAGSRASVPSPP